MDREAWHMAVHGVTVGHDQVTELNWIESVSSNILPNFKKLDC